MTMLEHRPVPSRYAAEVRLQTDALQALAEAKSLGAAADVAAAEKAVVTAHIGLATSLAHRYRGRSLDVDDLEQLAFLGLVKAVKRWDPEVGAEFVGFAYPTILGEIKRYFRDQLTTIRMPRPLQDLHVEANGLREDIRQRTGREATAVDLAAAAGVSTDQIWEERAASFQCRVASLYESEVHGAAAAVVSADAALEMRHVEDRMVIQQAMGKLTARERLVVDLRYLQDKSQAEIGDILGVSQMQVSRILRAIHHKLRASLTAPDDSDWVEQLAS